MHAVRAAAAVQAMLEERAARVTVRVVRELGCPEKIVRSLPDIPVAGFDIIELLGP